MPVDHDAVRKATRDLLLAIGEDPDRDGLAGTPDRVARWWTEFADYDPGTVDTAFAIDNVDEMVAVRGIGTWSLCEHHLLPFRATVGVAYLPAGAVLGLSKFGRIVHQAAHRLQVQERLVADVADAIEKITGTPDVAVVARGEHLCMSMRGVRTPAEMVTSVMRGRFRDDARLRSEFLSLDR